MINTLKNITVYSILFFFVSIDSVFSQNTVWMQHIRPGGNEYVWDVTADKYGNVYATGRVKFSSTFGWSPNTQSPAAIGAETDVFLAKHNPDGDLLWVKRDGGDQADWGRSMVVDNRSNVYIVGDFTDTALFGSNQILAIGSITNRNLFITKYDSSGNNLWAFSAGNSADHSRAYGIDVDDKDRPYLAGHVSGQANLNGANFGINGNNQPFVGALNKNGTVRWMRNFAATYGGEINDLKYLNGFIYLVGSFKGNMNINGTLHVGNSPSWRDVFCVKMDTLGNFIWSKSAVGGYNDQGYSIDVDQYGSVYILGTFANDLIFSGSTTINSLGTAGTAATANAQIDGFVAKYNSSGVFQWVRQVGAPHGVALSRMTIDRNCNKIYFTGSFRPPTYLVGYDTLVPFDSTFNSLLISLDYDGNYKWFKTYGGPGYSHTDGIALDPFGNIIQGGHFDQTVYFDTITAVATTGMDGFTIKMEPPLQPELSVNDSVFCMNDTIAFSFCQPGNITVDHVLLNNVLTAFLVNGNTVFVPVIQAGTYDLKVTLSNYLNTDTFFVNQISVYNSQLAQLGADTTLCENTQLVLNPGLFDSYLWNDGSVGQTLSADSAGIYYVSVVDPNQCSSSDSIQISFFTTQQVNLGNDTLICNGSTILLDAGVYQNYLWNDNSTGSTLSVSSSGFYYVEVTDSNTCNSTDSIQITVDSCLGFTWNEIQELSIYPNPFHDMFFIHSDKDLSGILEITNINGSLIYDRNIIINKNQSLAIQINAPSGIYFYEFTDQNNDRIRGKIIKQ